MLPEKIRKATEIYVRSVKEAERKFFSTPVIVGRISVKGPTEIPHTGRIDDGLLLYDADCQCRLCVPIRRLFTLPDYSKLLNQPHDGESVMAVEP